jgi:hypothetical protein
MLKAAGSLRYYYRDITFYFTTLLRRLSSSLRSCSLRGCRDDGLSIDTHLLYNTMSGRHM